MIQTEVKPLLDLKAKFKEVQIFYVWLIQQFIGKISRHDFLITNLSLPIVQVTGQDYVPGAAQVNKARDLLAAKAAKHVLQAAVKELFDLKAKYKEVRETFSWAK